MFKDHLFILPILLSISVGQELLDPCPGSGWTAFNTTKCFKLVHSHTVGLSPNVLSICHNDTSSSPTPQPAIITSVEEQNFLTDYIFNNSTFGMSVWFGLIKKDGTFLWMDGSPLTYTNWADGSPSDDDGRGCVEMRGRLSQAKDNSLSSDADGQWKDVSCQKANLVLCQKPQSLSFADLQNLIHQLSSSTANEILSLKNHIETLNQNASALQDQIDHLSEKVTEGSVPIGFIYTQLKDQPLPSDLWPGSTWSNITSEYSGLFFRAEGGSSAPFGQIQEASIPRIAEVEQDNKRGVDKIALPGSGWSGTVYTGNSMGNQRGISFKINDAEIKPRNMAVRFWKRTA